MRVLKIAILAALAIVLLVVALANASPVTIRLLPREFADLVGLDAAVTLPLFIVILGGVTVGLLIGFVWEWLREHKHRSTARARRREIERLEGRIEARKREDTRNGDDVLALLEDAERAR